MIEYGSLGCPGSQRVVDRSAGVSCSSLEALTATLKDLIKMERMLVVRVLNV